MRNLSCSNLPAEIENFAIIPDKPDPLARVHTGPTEITSLDTHGDDLSKLHLKNGYISERCCW